MKWIICLQREDLSQEDMYLMKGLVDFIKELGYLGGTTPQYEASRKHQKGLIETFLLIYACNKEDRKITFCVLNVLFTYHYSSYLQCANFSNHYLQIQ